MNPESVSFRTPSLLVECFVVDLIAATCYTSAQIELGNQYCELTSINTVMLVVANRFHSPLPFLHPILLASVQRLNLQLLISLRPHKYHQVFDIDGHACPRSVIQLGESMPMPDAKIVIVFGCIPKLHRTQLYMLIFSSNRELFLEKDACTIRILQ